MAEVIGNEPFEEEILETTLDARRRLLKPGARLIPHTLELVARPLRIPDAEARQRAIGRRAIERWRHLYGIEFQPLLDAAFRGPVNNPTEAEVLAGWPPWVRQSRLPRSSSAATTGRPSTCRLSSPSRPTYPSTPSR